MSEPQSALIAGACRLQPLADFAAVTPLILPAERHDSPTLLAPPHRREAGVLGKRAPPLTMPVHPETRAGEYFMVPV